MAAGARPQLNHLSIHPKGRLNTETGMKAINLYIGLVSAFSIALSFLVGLTGGHASPIFGLAYLSMFMPAFAVGIVYLVMKEAPLAAWHRFPVCYLPLALLLMPAVMHLAMLPAMAILEGALQWQDWLSPQSDGLYHTPPSRGWGNLTIASLIAHIAINALVGLAIVSFMAFFEEIGWRAWLLPRLKDRLGARWAIVLVAIIWALWHVPFELSGILHIDGVSPIKLALIMPLGTTAAGIVLGWLWIRSQSIWMVSIAHGALNNWGQYAFKYMRDTRAPDADIAVLTSGYFALLILGIVLLRHDGALEPENSPEHRATA
jgi:membrane protease YdiL (CAAX protease family)